MMIIVAIVASATALLPPPYDLRVEHRKTPVIGITEAAPRFSWRLPAAGRNISQRAYRVTVHTTTAPGITSSPHATTAVIWDSGLVVSTSTNGIAYNGSTALVTDGLYVVTATWSSNTGESSSAVSGVFEMGPMAETDWAGADWLGSSTMRRLRFPFTLPASDPVVGASASIDAPSCATVYVNGINVNGLAGVCPWTVWNQTTIFNVYNVTTYLLAGANAMAFQLGKARHTAPLRLRLAARLASGKALTFFSRGHSPPPLPPAPPAPPLSCVRARQHEVVELACASGNISGTKFASFGTATGSCKAGFSRNSSCDFDASSLVAQACYGRPRCVLRPLCKDLMCTINAWPPSFPDPCFGTNKQLCVSISCSNHTMPPSPRPSPAPGAGVWLGSQGPLRINSAARTHTQWNDHFADEGAGWASPSFDQSKARQKWTVALATVGMPTPTQHRTTSVPLSREVAVIIPATTTRIASNACLVSFGTNMVGTLVIHPEHVHIAAAGNITVLYSEVATNGTIQTNWSFGNQDVHMFDAAVAAVPGDIRPSFSWHAFQYVLVTTAGGVAVECVVKAFSGSNVRTNLAVTGRLHFDASTADGAFLNQLQSMVVRTQLANVVEGIPTDSPAREKHGWLGDALTTAEEAMFNADMEAVYEEFLNTIRDQQNLETGDVPAVVPESTKNWPRKRTSDISWSAAYPIIAGWLVTHYNNHRVAERHWPSLILYMDGLLAASRKEQPQAQSPLPDFFACGDWCAVAPRKVATVATGHELAAFNFISALDAMVLMGVEIGADAAVVEKYRKLALELRTVFHTRFYNRTTGTYGDDPAVLQSLAVAPLALGHTIPEAINPQIVAGLVNNTMSFLPGGPHLTVGSVGAKYLLRELASADNNELAMQVATTTTFPGWGYWLSQGATTCWEDWSGDGDATHPRTPTRSHIFLCGGLGEWLYRSVGGISPLANGYQRVVIFPDVPPVSSASPGPSAANTSVVTQRGKISVQWKRRHGDTGIEITVSLPAGVETGTILCRSPDPALATLEDLETGELLWSQRTGLVQHGDDATASCGVKRAEWTSRRGGLLEVDLSAGRYALACKLVRATH